MILKASSVLRTPAAKRRIGNNNAITNIKVNSNGNNSNDVEAAANAKNQTRTDFANKESNIEAFFSSYLGSGNSIYSTAGDLVSII
jgi:hypothetical protein